MAEYTVPPLPYDYGALEPHISAKTMQFHHDKHHQAYVNNLNAALKDHPEHQNQPIEQLIANLSALPEAIRTAVRNNGGGHANHSLFWTIMKPAGGGEPTGALAEAIASELGGLAPSRKPSTRPPRPASARAGPGSSSARTASSP